MPRPRPAGAEAGPSRPLLPRRDPRDVGRIGRFRGPVAAEQAIVGRMDPWKLELIVVREGSYSGGERRSLSRDVERGVLLRLRQGVYVEREAFLMLTAEQQHIVRMRALAESSPESPVFSHWSAAVLHGLPFTGKHLDRVHVTVSSDADVLRRRQGVGGHVAPPPKLLDRFGSLLATDLSSTVVDVALAEPFMAGVVIADGALRIGLPRWALEAAIDVASTRRGASRAAGVVAFAHPGAESAAESQSRCTQFRLGIPPLMLQFEVRDGRGLAGILDFFSKRSGAGGEVDGAKKYLDPALATRGAGRAVYDEKLREDRMRAQLTGLARWGWLESSSPTLLGPVLARVGIVPDRARASLQHYAEAAALATPRIWVPR